MKPPPGSRADLYQIVLFVSDVNHKVLCVYAFIYVCNFPGKRRVSGLFSFAVLIFKMTLADNPC